MTPFLSEDFLLQSATARTLYHEFAEGMPIFDYHCHLPQAHIADNHQCALRGQPSGSGRPDSRRASGDDRNLAGQPPAHASASCFSA